MDLPEPPATYQQFALDFPEITDAWERLQESGQVGPLDAMTQKLVKLAIAIGSGRSGAISSAVRKARAAGVTTEMMDQILRLSATTIGFPATVAVYAQLKAMTPNPPGSGAPSL